MKTKYRLFQAIVFAVLCAPLCGFSQIFTPEGVRGAAAGAVFGGIVGNQIHHQTGQGAIAGAVIGLLVGNTVHNAATVSVADVPRPVMRSTYSVQGERRVWASPSTGYETYGRNYAYADSSSPYQSPVYGAQWGGNEQVQGSGGARRSAYALDNPRCVGTVVGAVLGGVIQRRRGGDALTGIAVGGAAGYLLGSIR